MPKTSFEQTIGRAKAVVDFHKNVQSGGRPPRHLSDVLRGAVVLTVAGLDAAILDLVCRSIPTLAKQEGRLGRNVSKWIAERSEDTLRCFAETDPHRALGDLCREQLGYRTFQKAEQIEGILRDTLGCEAPWERAAERLTTKRETWTADRVKRTLNDYVERRNRIAHDGDATPSGKLREIQRPYVLNCIRVVEAVGLAANEIVTAHVKPAPKIRQSRSTRKAKTALPQQVVPAQVEPEPLSETPAVLLELPLALSASA